MVIKSVEARTLGHSIYWDEHSYKWRFCDNDDPVDSTQRPCIHCGHFPSLDGHDNCLNDLPGVKNACCGHGFPDDAYIQFENGIVIRGFNRIEYPREDD